MTEPNAANTLDNGTVRVWLAALTDAPTMPVKTLDLATLGIAWVELGHSTPDNLSIEASQDVQSRMSAALPKGVPYKRKVYAGPMTVSVDALEVTRETVDAAFGGGVFAAQSDGSVSFTPSATSGIKDFAAIVQVIDGNESATFVLTKANNVQAKVTMNPKQGDAFSLPLQLASVGTAGSPFGWYALIDTPGVVVGS